MVIFGHMSLLRTLYYYQEGVGLSVGLYQLNGMKVYCFVELYRPMCGYVKQFRAVESWNA